MIVTSPPLRRLVEPDARGPLVEIPCAIDTDLITITAPADSPERVTLGFPALRSGPSGCGRVGPALVRCINELGLIVDLSHCGPCTTLQAIEHAHAPVTVSHSACSTVYEHAQQE